MLIPLTELLQEARRGGYAIAAFNVANSDMVAATMEVAQEVRSPLILLALGRDIDLVAGTVRAAIRRFPRLPVVLHLDHGRTFAEAIHAVRHGFSSVMVDGSVLPYADNLALTLRVVELARAAGCSVEAEIGHVGVGSDHPSRQADQLTDPEEAAGFARDSGADCLAVAVGTAHGVYQHGIPSLDFPRLEEIARQAEIPLVLHGGSGTPPEQLRRAIAAGVAKINVATDVRRAFIAGFRQTAAEPGGDVNLNRCLKAARQAVAQTVRTWVELAGSANRF
ncbi:MAG TPA: tagatose-bisphosphate aldolase [Clostridiales bacterium]|nr:tagatose-bisphosphate aldolase [Clostridiales bacterium]